MKLNRLELAGIVAAFVLVLLSGVFALSQTVYADDVPVDPCADIFSQLPGMGCGASNGANPTPVDPCEITPCGEDESLGEQITCAVYEDLIAQGQPIPEGFDASGCGDDGGGGGAPACSDGVDNDSDGAIDGDDPGCSGADDDDETNTGGGGNTPAACADGLDNDNDGKVDMDDPGCSSESDADETDGSSGGGGGNGGGSSSGGSGGGGGSVLGVESIEACNQYLTKFIKFKGANDEEQVARLQHVLKEYEGAEVEESGVYDDATLAAVHAFQTKYWETILAPWNLSKSTGFVYLTTRKKVNEIYCKNEVMFPLTDEESALIEASKSSSVTEKGSVKPVATQVEVSPVKTETKEVESKGAAAVSESGATRRNGWGFVGDFFRRLFNRGN